MFLIKILTYDPKAPISSKFCQDSTSFLYQNPHNINRSTLMLTILLFQSMFSNFCIYVRILQREKQQTEHSKIIKFNFQTSSLYVQYYLDCQTNEQAWKHMFPNNQSFLLKKCWHYFCCWSWSLIKQASKNEQTHKCSKYYKLSNTWVIVTNTKTNTISNFSFDCRT